MEEIEGSDKQNATNKRKRTANGDKRDDTESESEPISKKRRLNATNRRVSESA